MSSRRDSRSYSSRSSGSEFSTYRTPRSQSLSTEARRLEDLFRAARFGDHAEVSRILESGISVDARDPATGNTLLCVAAQNGNKRVVKLALRQGANINHANQKGNTPLHFAYGFGFREVGDYLLEKKADIAVQNLEMLTPLEGISPDKPAVIGTLPPRKRPSIPPNPGASASAGTGTGTTLLLTAADTPRLGVGLGIQADPATSTLITLPGTAIVDTGS